MSDNFRISIHALLAESDLIALFDFPIVPVISIHALLAESDVGFRRDNNARCIFLSTLSLRRATESQPPCAHPTTNFYPRSPCGERRQRRWLDSTHRRISIHALLAESDVLPQHCWSILHYFYPRSPCGERPQTQTSIRRGHRNFYPRSPCGERRILSTLIIGFLEFLSTLSLRRATRAC